MYYTIQKGSILTAENKGALSNYYDNVQVLPSDYEVGKYIVENNSLVLNPNFEAEQALKEKERIAKLNLTGADVERGIYQAKGMDFDDIIALVEYLSKGELDLETGEIINKGVDIDVKALKIELKANHFYRGSEYVSKVGALLGFTPEQLDKFFETNNYTYLLVKTEEELPTDEIVEQEGNTEVQDEDTTNTTV
jgi:hypothetical protein